MFHSIQYHMCYLGMFVWESDCTIYTSDRTLFIAKDLIEFLGKVVCEAQYISTVHNKRRCQAPSVFYENCRFSRFETQG